MISNFPDVRQSRAFDCGAAVVDGVCKYFEINHRRSYYRKLLGTNGINGTDPRTIEAFLRGERLGVLSGDMSLDDLKFQTGLGRPVITLATLHNNGHYIVALGVFKRRGETRVSYHDPLCGRQTMEAEEFMSIWVDFDRFGTVYRQFGLSVWY